MTPPVEEILEATVNGYEDMVRRACDLQRALARAVPLAAARSILNTTADLNRDIAAVQLSGVRWLLDS